MRILSFIAFSSAAIVEVDGERRGGIWCLVIKSDLGSTLQPTHRSRLQSCLSCAILTLKDTDSEVRNAERSRYGEVEFKSILGIPIIGLQGGDILMQGKRSGRRAGLVRNPQ